MNIWGIWADRWETIKTRCDFKNTRLKKKSYNRIIRLDSVNLNESVNLKIEL